MFRILVSGQINEEKKILSQRGDEYIATEDAQ